VTVDRVYIVGAGASVPYGLPTLKTLTWDLCETLNGPERRTFIKAVYEACGVELRGPESSPDFEELLTDWIPGRSSTSRGRATAAPIQLGSARLKSLFAGSAHSSARGAFRWCVRPRAHSTA
jgi:hypothetical protein